MIQVAPSILSADFSRLGEEIQQVDKAGADLIHLDVMDGHFVPNLTFGAPIIKSIRPYTKLKFDTHLMMTNPIDFISDFANAGSDFITVHVESENKTEDLISVIRKNGCQVGLSLRPKTNINKIIPFLPMIDLVLIMSVEPGFGGQMFQKEALEKIVALKELIGKKNVKISVDGGINNVTAPACVMAGADILVAGSYVFKSDNYRQAIERLKQK